MPRVSRSQQFRVEEFTNPSGRVSWRVCGTRRDGTRVRRNFRTKAEAVVALSEEEETEANLPSPHRALRTSLRPDQLADAEAATKAAGERSLSRLVSSTLDFERRAAAKGADLDAAISFFEAHFREETSEISILNARAEFLASRVGISPTTLAGYENSTAQLLKPDPNKPVHRITVGDLEKILGRHRNLNSRKTHQRIFGILFNWAVRHHYCLENPCGRLDKVPAPTTEIAILSVDEVLRLLQAAVEYKDGSMVPVVAIALFAGLRPSEIHDLGAEDVNGERIRVSGGKMRRKIKRAVPIPDNLKAWLETYPFTGLPDACVYRMKVLKEATKAKIWVSDILRHTSISYQAERDKNEGLTAFNNGTSKVMMDRHYRDVIDDPKTVKAYWSITPQSLAKEKIKVKLPHKDDREWPSKVKLKKLVWERPMIHVAKDLGVSDVALKKKCVKLGIGLPPRGYWLKPR